MDTAGHDERAGGAAGPGCVPPPDTLAPRAAWDRAAAAAWAARVLADPGAVVLDTETTGLGPDAAVVEIAVLATDGTVLLDTLVDPQAPIPAAASAIHGLTDTDVAGAPTFPRLLPDLEEILTGRRLIAYNADYDTAILCTELDRHHDARHGPSAVPLGSPWHGRCRHRRTAAWWDRIAGIDCAMRRYAAWRGCWDPVRGGYTRHRLAGGHRARSDCRAVLALLAGMTDDAAPPRPRDP